ncbi:MAG: tetratricopeptide repeat protein [Calditrichaeota bacterium]|nr:MAG: tetratricopeptide repeat protein [Calditrichota bacterium]
MKFWKSITITALALLFIIGSQADARKLPVGAYIKSAKIEILSGDLERYQNAIILLDSLFLNYGPHAEGIFWMGQIEVDYIDRAPSPAEKKPHVERFQLFTDSLHFCCDKENKDVKKKYKKDCDEFIEKSDSIAVKYWREFYNSAVEQMKTITSLNEDISNEVDTAIIERFKNDIQLNVDSAATNFELCLILDSAKEETYAGLGLLFEKAGDYEKAIEWRDKGLPYTSDKATALIQIAYSYINMGDYKSPIPYMKEYIDLRPEDTLTMSNLVICYNNNQMYDSAYAINQRILTVAPDNFDALKSLGLYFGQISRDANDSAAFYAENPTEKEIWSELKNQGIDSAITYFEKALESNPDDAMVNELFGTYTYIKGDFEKSSRAFKKLAELKPSVPDFWTSLGDCYIQLKNFEDATSAYEKTVELTPDNKAVWEQLVDLYSELGRTADKAAAEKKVKSL